MPCFSSSVLTCTVAERWLSGPSYSGGNHAIITDFVQFVCQMNVSNLSQHSSHFCTNTLIALRFPSEWNLRCVRTFVSTTCQWVTVKKPPHPPQHHLGNTSDAHTLPHELGFCRHRVTWPQRAECLSQLISIEDEMRAGRSGSLL